MTKIIFSLLILAATTFAADARLFGNLRWFEDLDRNSDIIVIAKPISTTDTNERTNLAPISSDVHFIGLSSVFEVVFVLKGDTNLTKLVVHHYRFADPVHTDPDRWAGEVALASFDPKKSTRYLLFLHREPDGRYAPSEQFDSSDTSLLKLSEPAWDKMTADDFKSWMDAKRWLREGPVPGSPEITPYGRAEGSLHEAAMNGKLEKAKALIKANPDLVNSHASHAEQTPLHMAAEYGHKEVAELLLANKADIEAKDHDGWTPLFSAVYGRQKELVELLVTNKANVNSQEASGQSPFQSPLEVAAELGYTEIAALLLANGANVNSKSRYETPLHIAAVCGHKDLVDLLVANKADYNIQDAAAIGDLDKVKMMLKANPNLVFSNDVSGQTALYWAIMRDQTDMVKLLLANKADVNAKATHGDWTLLSEAISNGYKDILELLLAGGADVNAKSGNTTPLHRAIAQDRKDIADLLVANKAEFNIQDVAAIGDLDRVKALLKANPDLVFSKDSSGYTALYWAAMRGQTNMVKFLLANKADVNARTGDGLTPLLMAVITHQQRDVVELLVAGGSDVNAKRAHGSPLLFDAVLTGQKGVVELLVAGGADVNVKIKDETPLHFAAMLGHKDLVDLLVANKAEYNIQDAAAIGDLETVKMMLKANPNLVFSNDFAGYTALHWAALAMGGQTNMVKLLLANKADVNAKKIDSGSTPSFVNAPAGNRGSTPLHMAVSSQHKDVVELLLANKADVNVKDEVGETPLYIAAEKGYTAIAAFLLENKAEVNASDNAARTPLHVAVGVKNLGDGQNGHIDMVELLLANKAEINAKDNSGSTPLDYAAIYDTEDMVELLLDNKADINIKDSSGRTPLDYAVRYNTKGIADFLRQHGGLE